MKAFLIVISCIIFYCCNFTYENNTNHDVALAQLKRETDSLKNELNQLKKQSIKKDTLVNTIKLSLAKKDSISVDSISREIVKPGKKAIPNKTSLAKKSDTTFYYYINTKKISVKIHPRNDYGEKRKIQFYDLKGNVTFEQEDIYASYSISTEIKEFHPTEL